MDLDQLINVPIELPESYGASLKVQQKEKLSTGQEQRAFHKANKKTWKRNQGKENVEPRKIGDKLKGLEQSGTKRQWQLLDKPEDLCSPLINSKRYKENYDLMTVN